MLNEKVNNAIEIHYVHGDDLISQDSASNIRYYHTDGLGSTRHLSDAGGSLTDSYDYAAFGELLNSTGASENRYLFTGEQFDAFTSHYYLRARYYSPHSARFTQMDPFQGVNRVPATLNKYSYTHNDPANLTDPSGEFVGNIQALQMQASLSTFAVTGGAGAITRVSVSLLVAGFITFSTGDQLKDMIASPAAQKILELDRKKLQERVKEEVRVGHRRRGRRVLYHYTGRAGAMAIGTFGVGLSSAGFGRGRPPGFYAANIPPWSTQYTQESLSALFFGGNINRDVSWFVAIDGTSFIKFPGNTYEYYRPSSTGETDLDVITIGPNLMSPR